MYASQLECFKVRRSPRNHKMATIFAVDHDWNMVPYVRDYPSEALAQRALNYFSGLPIIINDDDTFKFKEAVK